MPFSLDLTARGHHLVECGANSALYRGKGGESRTELPSGQASHRTRVLVASWGHHSNAVLIELTGIELPSHDQDESSRGTRSYFCGPARISR